MKIKTSELHGAALDWVVAKAEGLIVYAVVERDCGQAAHRPLGRWAAINLSPVGHDIFGPSTNWSQGGPIIEEMLREGLHIHSLRCRYPTDTTSVSVDLCGEHRSCAGTILIAAMRCRVASKLGDEVDVPNELL